MLAIIERWNEKEHSGVSTDSIIRLTILSTEAIHDFNKAAVKLGGPAKTWVIGFPVPANRSSVEQQPFPHRSGACHARIRKA